MPTTQTSGAEPSPVPADPGAGELRPTKFERPVVGLEGQRLELIRRLHSGLGRVRPDRRRLVPAVVVATMAAAMTYGGLGTMVTRTEPASHQPAARPRETRTDEPAETLAEGDPSSDDGDGSDPVVIGGNHRTLALDRHAVLLPAEVGNRVEVVALLPTLESVEASVVAESATVVAVDDSAVVVRLTAEEARRAIEAAAVGSLTLLGTG